MPAVQWSNGKVDSAPTWEDLLERIRVDQQRRYTPEGFREELARRAWIWNQYVIDTDPELPAWLLFAELEAAKLLRIVEGDN